MLVGLFCAALAVMCLFPETQIARQLRRVLIEQPAQWLAGLSAIKIWRWSLAAVAIGVALVIAMQTPDAIVILQIVPEAIAWFASVEVATYLEIITAIWLLRAGLSLRSARQAARLAIASLASIARRVVRACFRHSRDARRQRPARRPKPDNEDEDGAVFAFA